MDLQNRAFQFLVRANGYDEKVRIVQEVAKRFGRKGLFEFADLIRYKVEDLEHYAQLSIFFEDKNRRRRQRKPKARPTAVEQIEALTYKKMQHSVGVSKYGR